MYGIFDGHNSIIKKDNILTSIFAYSIQHECIIQTYIHTYNMHGLVIIKTCEIRDPNKKGKSNVNIINSYSCVSSFFFIQHVLLIKLLYLFYGVFFRKL
jgi:hypothetical protein